MIISAEYVCLGTVIGIGLFHCPSHQVKQNNCRRPRLNPLIQGEGLGWMSVG